MNQARIEDLLLPQLMEGCPVAVRSRQVASRAFRRRDETVTLVTLSRDETGRASIAQMRTPSMPAAVPPEPRPIPTLTGPASSPVTRPPGVSIEGSVVADRIYRGAILGFALCVPILLVLIFVEVGVAGWPALSQFGLRLPHVEHVGPGGRRVRRRAGDLRHARRPRVIALVIATPLALGGGDLPLRVRAGAGCGSRCRSSSTCSPRSRASCTGCGESSSSCRCCASTSCPSCGDTLELGRDAVLQRAGVRAERARGRVDPRDHGASRTSPPSRARCCWPSRARSARRRSRSARRAGR